MRTRDLLWAAVVLALSMGWASDRKYRRMFESATVWYSDGKGVFLEKPGSGDHRVTIVIRDVD